MNRKIILVIMFTIITLNTFSQDIVVNEAKEAFLRDSDNSMQMIGILDKIIDSNNSSILLFKNGYWFEIKKDNTNEHTDINVNTNIKISNDANSSKKYYWIQIGSFSHLDSALKLMEKVVYYDYAVNLSVKHFTLTDYIFIVKIGPMFSKDYANSRLESINNILGTKISWVIEEEY